MIRYFKPLLMNFLVYRKKFFFKISILVLKKRKSLIFRGGGYYFPGNTGTMPKIGKKSLLSKYDIEQMNKLRRGRANFINSFDLDANDFLISFART